MQDASQRPGGKAGEASKGSKAHEEDTEDVASGDKFFQSLRMEGMVRMEAVPV